MCPYPCVEYDRSYAGGEYLIRSQNFSSFCLDNEFSKKKNNSKMNIFHSTVHDFMYHSHSHYSVVTIARINSLSLSLSLSLCLSVCLSVYLSLSLSLFLCLSLALVALLSRLASHSCVSPVTDDLKLNSPFL